MGGTETSAVLKDLSSLTEYEIAVFAVYTSSASEALRGRETTRESHTQTHTLTQLPQNHNQHSVHLYGNLIACAVSFYQAGC